VSDGLVQTLATRLASASRVTVLTGAGVSAASGVPTFRGEQGLWRQYRPEDLATREAFYENPALVWEWYAWRRELIRRCEPNAAHEVLARWSSRTGFTLITQNVDDLHHRAGSERVVRLHGSIWELSCFDRCAPGSVPWRDERVPLPVVPPACPHCGGHARPGVVWFGEYLDPAVVAAATTATTCDVFLTIGTSSVVYPAAGLLQSARAKGAFTAEINLEPTPASGVVDVSIPGAAEVVLPLLDAR
jgi:NAD-dependent deacetylase